LQGVASLGLVVMVGKGQVPEKLPLVAIVGSETCHMMVVVVIAMLCC